MLALAANLAADHLIRCFRRTEGKFWLSTLYQGGNILVMFYRRGSPMCNQSNYLFIRYLQWSSVL